MKETKLWNVLTADGSKTPYGMAESLEIRDLPEGSTSVKCTDTLFLVRTEGKAALYDSRTETMNKLSAYDVTDEADGFSTEISMAPDVILPAEFADGKMVIADTVFPVTVRKAEEKMLIIQFEEDETVLFDTSRFLLYAYVNDRFFCGYVEV